MPRQARILIKNYPHHIVHRGHNQAAIFHEPADYRQYLRNLARLKTEFGLEIYSFCLMTNHVHLIANPLADPARISRLMKRLAGRHTRYINRKLGRSGSLWGGRYHVSPIDTDAYLMECCRYVELNPVKAGMVELPGEYPWSSYRAKVGNATVPWLDCDPAFLALGENQAQRVARYRQFVENAPRVRQTQKLIREAAARNQLTGGTAFRDRIEAEIGVRVQNRGPGRPRKG